MKKIVLVTGGFDPLHSGHIEYFKEARELGDELHVGLNSDEWLTRKKGRPFMPFKERLAIIQQLSMVDNILSFDDSDDTVCEAIKRLKPTYFANGGDRGRSNTPEQSVCEELGIKLLWGIGGEEKLDSSSELAKKARDFELPPNRAKSKVSER